VKLSPLGLAILCFAETFEAHAYLDSGGVWTIGYGHTGDVHQGMTCTMEQAKEWLRQDLQRFEQAVGLLVHVPLTQTQFDALVIFSFNVGTGARGLGGSTLLKFLNADDTTSAAEQFQKWDEVRGIENAGLERRRQLEKALFLT
jgi:lysozyme